MYEDTRRMYKIGNVTFKMSNRLVLNKWLYSNITNVQWGVYKDKPGAVWVVLKKFWSS